MSSSARSCSSYFVPTFVPALRTTKKIYSGYASQLLTKTFLFPLSSATEKKMCRLRVNIAASLSLLLIVQMTDVQCHEGEFGPNFSN